MTDDTFSIISHLILLKKREHYQILQILIFHQECWQLGEDIDFLEKFGGYWWLWCLKGMIWRPQPNKICLTLTPPSNLSPSQTWCWARDISITWLWGEEGGTCLQNLGSNINHCLGILLVCNDETIYTSQFNWSYHPFVIQLAQNILSLCQKLLIWICLNYFLCYQQVLEMRGGLPCLQSLR